MLEGIPYFPLECIFDDNMKLLEAEFGLVGVGIMIKIHQRIYGELGYYCKWNDEVALLFGRKECMTLPGDNVVSEVIKAALNRGIFDKGLYKKFGILTSAKIQDNYLKATKRRKNSEVKKEYLLLSVPKMQENADINEENADKFEENVSKNKQSRVEESRANKSKNICCEQAHQQAFSLLLKGGTEYILTKSDINAWQELYPAVDIGQEFRKMKAWLYSNPERRKTRKGIKRFINSWLGSAAESWKPLAEGTSSISAKEKNENEVMRRAEALGLEV